MASFALSDSFLPELAAMNVGMTGRAIARDSHKFAYARNFIRFVAENARHCGMFVWQGINRVRLNAECRGQKAFHQMAGDTVRIFRRKLSFVLILVAALAVFFKSVISFAERVGIFPLKFFSFPMALLASRFVMREI